MAASKPYALFSPHSTHFWSRSWTSVHVHHDQLDFCPADSVEGVTHFSTWGKRVHGTKFLNRLWRDYGRREHRHRHRDLDAPVAHLVDIHGPAREPGHE